jgi:hypothetical protein
MGYFISRVRIDTDTVLIWHGFIEVSRAEGIAVERAVTYADLQMGRIEPRWRILADTSDKPND